MSFDEDYPTLMGHWNLKIATKREREIISRCWTENVIKDSCKDNQRIREAIEKVKYKDNPGYEWEIIGLVDPDELLKELGLDK